MTSKKHVATFRKVPSDGHALIVKCFFVTSSIIEAHVSGNFSSCELKTSAT